MSSLLHTRDRHPRSGEAICAFTVISASPLPPFHASLLPMLSVFKFPAFLPLGGLSVPSSGAGGEQGERRGRSAFLAPLAHSAELLISLHTGPKTKV